MVAGAAWRGRRRLRFVASLHAVNVRAGGVSIAAAAVTAVDARSAHGVVAGAAWRGRRRLRLLASLRAAKVRASGHAITVAAVTALAARSARGRNAAMRSSALAGHVGVVRPFLRGRTPPPPLPYPMRSTTISAWATRTQ